jgi:hypothetical protein
VPVPTADLSFAWGLVSSSDSPPGPQGQSRGGFAEAAVADRRTVDTVRLSCRTISSSCGAAAAGPGLLRSVTALGRWLPSAWNGSWNDAPDNPSAAGAVSAMTPCHPCS